MSAPFIGYKFSVLLDILLSIISTFEAELDQNWFDVEEALFIAGTDVMLLHALSKFVQLFAELHPDQ